MPEHLLLTGGAGFVGSHLAEAWIARGGRVTVLDDLSSGRVANLAQLSTAGSPLELVRGSVLDRTLVARLSDRADRVAHLASVVGVARVCAQPSRTREVIELGTRHVAEAAAERDLPLLVTSSSEVYGCPVRVPLAEDGPLLAGASDHPRFAYARAKLAAERTALEATGGGAVVVRLFNTTGPRQDPGSGMVVPRLCERALAGRPLEVYGGGRQTRCFAHVGDVAAALVSLSGEVRARGAVINVGDDREVPIGELARRVAARVPGASVVARDLDAVFGPDFPDPARRVPDLARLRGLVPRWRSRGLEAILTDVLAALEDGQVAPARIPGAERHLSASGRVPQPAIRPAG